MTSIAKTQAVVLKKTDYSNSSCIYTFYTSEFGKINGLLKGAKRSNTKIGNILDVMNVVEIVFYDKSTREVQTITDASLVTYNRQLKEDFDKLKYGFAIIDLLYSHILEGEANRRLFKGLVRILDLLNNSNENSDVLFLKFLIFFVKELGFEIQTDHCNICLSDIENVKNVAFDFHSGLLCENCYKTLITAIPFDDELNIIKSCMKKEEFSVSEKQIKRTLKFFENYLQIHVHNFNKFNNLLDINN